MLSLMTQFVLPVIMCWDNKSEDEVGVIQLWGCCIWLRNECSDVVMLSGDNVEYGVFPKGYSSGNYNMQERVFNVLMEECSAFLRFLMMMACSSRYNVYVMWMLHYHVFRSSVAQMMKLVVAICLQWGCLSGLARRMLYIAPLCWLKCCNLEGIFVLFVQCSNSDF